MKIVLSVAFVMLLASSQTGAFAADAPDEKKPSFWMEKKLEYSQKILAALATQDFQEIGKKAHSLAALNQMERWVRAGVPEYQAQLHIFQNANQQLINAANHENLDAAALAYVQLTMSCVNCHKVIRDTPKATSNGPK
jgi:hypothetical protein